MRVDQPCVGVIATEAPSADRTWYQAAAFIEHGAERVRGKRHRGDGRARGKAGRLGAF